MGIKKKINKKMELSHKDFYIEDERNLCVIAYFSPASGNNSITEELQDIKCSGNAIFRELMKKLEKNKEELMAEIRVNTNKLEENKEELMREIQINTITLRDRAIEVERSSNDIQ